MKKFLSIVACFMLAFTSFAFVACKKSEPYEPPRRVVQALPDKLHVEYDTYGVVFVKDGNEYYCVASNVHGAHRSPMYMKNELTNEYFVEPGYGGWDFITAIRNYEDNGWVVANGWHEDDKNRTTHSNAEYKTRTGYIDVNIDTDIYTSATVTQLSNQTLTLASNQQVECVVWDYVYENGDTYGHHRYWYAVDTGVFIKEMYTSNKNANIETTGTLESIATYYAVGESMDAVLTTKGLSKPDLSEYV